MFLCNMEVLKIKIESFFDEKQDDLLDIKLMKKENETFTITNINTEQPSELLQDDVISMFSYSDDEDQDGSHYNVMNVKTEFEYRRDIEFELERTPDIKTSVNTCYGSQVPGYHVIKQEDHITEDIKSLNNNISVETKLSENNLTAFNIHQNDDKLYSCGKTFDKLKQQKRIHSGEKLYYKMYIVVCKKHFNRTSYLKLCQR
ncbi:uncharacterized protein LOC143240973 isoform X1 [Tachypleus tridentatus]|uniref:uncharacterized protein LOC143240973 isoform X1 n=1 Tax=Tachypleus tridentatus TaxID=6853 RepID=UPI003FD4877D